MLTPALMSATDLFAAEYKMYCKLYSTMYIEKYIVLYSPGQSVNV